ncbi:MerR family transcriptional regulator [Leptolyngbya sp. 'hensonii']|uniref:MerR family transcriptional regulator n=1 Tax=Leptolyngbya sp. 'hensonii' TaxID=1922337 RepID=UPI000950152C|nr:MerR family transcriptional regulator [Leptolyngbya sp. 'hensonii']OLP18250.1 MerR family transcriptional regulator [Leptolyngbya sp. 'hensonii']
MATLKQFSELNPSWSLDEFVQTLNTLLPQFLPAQKAHSRVREEVTPRLVRYYAAQGLLDEALKEGREARYTYRHLLQMLVVRRLLTEGYGASAINTLTTARSNAELEALLEGGMQLTVTTANPALAYLQEIQQRQGMPAPQVLAVPAQPSSQISLPTNRWIRLEVLPGLEVHVREDFTIPTSPQEQQNLLQHILQKLSTLIQKRRPSR